MEYKKEKISTYQKFSLEALEEMSIKQIEDDFYQGLMTAELSNFIATSMRGKYSGIMGFKRPTFLDWLLRRSRYMNYTIDVKEIFPSELWPKDNRIYEINIEYPKD